MKYLISINPSHPEVPRNHPMSDHWYYSSSGHLWVATCTDEPRQNDWIGCNWTTDQARAEVEKRYPYDYKRQIPEFFQ